MKRVLIIFLLVLISSAACLPSGGAFGEIREFKNFSLDVPENWSFQEQGPTVLIIADDKSGSLSITYDNPQGNSIGDLAAALSLELGGTMPEKDNDGIYSFEFGGGKSQALITGDEDFYMLIIGMGFDKNADTLGEILESLEMK